jgi:hypothetical protein
VKKKSAWKVLSQKKKETGITVDCNPKSVGAKAADGNRIQQVL